MTEGPSDAEVEARVVAVLDTLGGPYELMPCDPALADTAAFCEAYGVPLDRSANCILVASKNEPKQYAACLVLATNRLDVNGTVRRLMGVRKASFAAAEETAALTGMMIGGVTPLGLPEGVPLYLDAAMMPLEGVIVGGGSRSLKVRLAPALLARLPGAQVVEGLGI
ncbi:MAG: YbaK/EbsC family protein [Dehalococcoidia bacterium]|nr:YbaK/EbsC family protein [Dehalococcoidia bacterium]